MSRSPNAPAWLEAYQARFSAMLRTPLDRSTRSLRAQPREYPHELCAEVQGALGIAPAERLAYYNRQYWFRLFTLLQEEYRLTTRLLGAWSFNGLASRFLEDDPPREHDLACVADGFVNFLERTLPEQGVRLEAEKRTLPSRALVQAARIDDAFRCVFRAPAQPAFVPSADDAEGLEHARLQWSTAVRLVEEDWPLLELRKTPGDNERALPLPEPHPEPRHFVICRVPEGFRTYPLEPLAAMLMRLLEALPLDRALAELEHAVPPAEREGLAARAQRWLAEGVRQGYWTGLVR